MKIEKKKDKNSNNKRKKKLVEKALTKYASVKQRKAKKT